jgi:hypothetical protein
VDLGLNEEDESAGRRGCGCGSSRRSSCVITSARCLPGPTNRVRRTVQGSVGRVDLVYESRMGCFGVQSLVEIQPNRGFGPVRPARRLDQAADGQAQAKTKTTEAEQILKKKKSSRPGSMLVLPSQLAAESGDEDKPIQSRPRGTLPMGLSAIFAPCGAATTSQTNPKSSARYDPPD